MSGEISKKTRSQQHSQQQSYAAKPEVGVILSLMVLGLYMLGFLQELGSVPDAAPHHSRGAAYSYQHLGENINLARDSTNVVRGETFVSPLEREIERLEKLQARLDGPGDGLDPVQREQELLRIPLGQWPVSTRGEQMESVVHPGDLVTILELPKLWSLPVHQNKLMSRETAMRIGTCAEPDSNGNHVRGEECPEDQRTIFVAIASYRDYQCRLTVESIFTRAKNPKRIRVGVVDQIEQGVDVRCNEPVKPCDENPQQALCLYKDQVDVVTLDAILSIGPVFARHVGHRQYRGEYYSTQSDAHVTYTVDWDADIVRQLESTQNEMAVLTTYLTDIQGSIDEQGRSLRNTRPIMCNTDYEGGAQGMHLRHLSQPELRPVIHGSPQLQPWWAAGYSFSRGHFVVNVPYDPYQPMIFQGEEMSIGLRGYTIGYDYYAPESSVCFHHYAVGKNAAKRNKVKHFWDNNARYAGTGKKAMARLLGIVHMNPEVPSSAWDHKEEDTYGLGGVRTPERFYEIFGIHVVRKTVEHHLCQFVAQGGMHRRFQPLVRKDGMGIDYSGVTYKFVDPQPGQKN